MPPPFSLERFASSGASFGLAALFGALFLGVVWLWNHDVERPALEQLPPEARRAAYTAALKDVETLCRPPVDPGLGDHCEEQARFLSKFPECDDACQALITVPPPPVRPR